MSELTDLRFQNVELQRALSNALGDNILLKDELAKRKTTITVLSLDLEVSQMHLDQARAEIYSLKEIK